MKDEPTNGDKAFLDPLRMRIAEINRAKDYESKEADIFGLQLLIISYERIVKIDNRVRRYAAHPSLLFLIMNRPLSFIPFSLAAGVGAFSLSIDEVRLQLISVLGLPPDLFADFGKYSAGLILVLVVAGLIARSKYVK